MQTTGWILSCDWGTTAFRLRVVDKTNASVIAEQKSNEGNNATFELWKQSGKQESERLSFYLSIVKHHISALEQKLQTSLDKVPLVVSGMASSTIGMLELPYKELPFSIDGSDLQVEKIKATDTFNHDILIISGAKTKDDVMRGEETKITGCLDNDQSFQDEQLFILPGTHPKHIIIRNGKVTSFQTYMTGEYFDLLSRKSILSNSIEEGGDLEQGNIKGSFEQGVRDSLSLNLLHSSFLVRTNSLFNKYTKQENFYYLSGLLIGTELKEYASNTSAKITIVGDNSFTQLYTTAFYTLLSERSIIIQTKDADEALINGQIKIYKQISK